MEKQEKLDVHWSFGLEVLDTYLFQWLRLSAVMFIASTVLAACLIIGVRLGAKFFLQPADEGLFFFAAPFEASIRAVFFAGEFFIGFLLFVLLILFLASLTFILSVSAAIYRFAERRLQGEMGWLYSPFYPIDWYPIIRLFLVLLLLCVVLFGPLFFVLTFSSYFASFFLSLVFFLTYAVFFVYVLVRFYFAPAIVVIDDTASVLYAFIKAIQLSMGNFSTLFALLMGSGLAGGRSTHGVLFGLVIQPFAAISLLHTLEKKRDDYKQNVGGRLE